jgi:hypothetical protein
MKMASAFYKYLEMRGGKFELEDFKLKNENLQIMENEDEKSKNFLSEFIKQDIKKQNVGGKAGYRKFMFQGAVLGGLAGAIVGIVEQVVPKFGLGMAKMYGSIGGLAGPIGILIGIVVMALIFAVGKYVYSSEKPDLPPKLNMKLTQRTEITPVTNLPPNPTS